MNDRLKEKLLKRYPHSDTAVGADIRELLTMVDEQDKRIEELESQLAEVVKLVDGQLIHSGKVKLQAILEQAILDATKESE